MSFSLMPRISHATKYVVLASVAVAFIWWMNKGPNMTLLSSKLSPDGSFVVENYLIDECLGECATGRIDIRNLRNGRSEGFSLPKPMAGIFFRWFDANHLVIFLDKSSAASSLSMPRQLSEISISYETYTPLNAATAVAQARLLEKRTISASSTSATFSKASVFEQMRDGRRCDLTVSAKDKQGSQEIGVEIIARTRSCSTELSDKKSCGRMESLYWFSPNSQQPSTQILTSADIDGADGYALLPTGKDHEEIRGQFLGSSASSVVRILNKSSFSVIYMFDFLDYSLRYEIPTSSISEEIAQFQECVKDADFEWLEHIK